MLFRLTVTKVLFRHFTISCSSPVTPHICKVNTVTRYFLSNTTFLYNIPYNAKTTNIPNELSYFSENLASVNNSYLVTMIINWGFSYLRERLSQEEGTKINHYCIP